MLLQNMGGRRCAEELKHLGLFALPSQSTVKRYRNFSMDGSGWTENAATEAAKLVADKGACALGGLAFDEMKIKSGLVFKLSTNELVGFVDLSERREGDYLSDLLAGRDVDVSGLVSLVHATATHVLEFCWSSLGTTTCR